MSKNKNTLVVNLFAGAGAGKSTFSASLFAELKKRDVDCEIATEYAKDCVWEDRTEVFNHQLYITGKQYYRIARVIGKVDVVITDSPLLLGAVYDVDHNKNFKNYLLDIHNSWNNFNIYLMREDDYNQNGRNQTQNEAIAYDKKILELLNDNDIRYVYCMRNDVIHMADVVQDILNGEW